MENTLFQDEANPGAGTETAPERKPEAPAADDRNAAVESERESVEQERRSLREQLLRKQAEFDNFRKRTDREKADLRAAITMATVEQLLPVLDGLDRALANPPAAEAASDYSKGLELVHKQFREALDRLGVRPVAATGQPFDPQLHHAVEMVKSSDHEDHTVIEEYQRGYTLHDRLIRPAMVRVAVKE